MVFFVLTLGVAAAALLYTYGQGRRRAQRWRAYCIERGFSLVRAPMWLTSQLERWTRRPAGPRYERIGPLLRISSVDWEISGELAGRQFRAIGFASGRTVGHAVVFDTSEPRPPAALPAGLFSAASGVLHGGVDDGQGDLVLVGRGLVRVGPALDAMLADGLRIRDAWTVRPEPETQSMTVGAGAELRTRTPTGGHGV